MSDEAKIITKPLRAGLGAGGVPYSGRTGFLNGITMCQDWGIDFKAALAGYVNSATKGGEAQLPGWQSWGGDFKVHTAVGYNYAPLVPSSFQTFAGSLDGTNGVNGGIIIDSLDIEWDIEGAKAIEQSVKFSGCGAFSVGAQVGSDLAVPNALTSWGTNGVLSLVGFPTAAASGGLTTAQASTQVIGVKSMKMSFTAKNTQYKDSSTLPWVNYLPGNITGTVSWTVNVYNNSTLSALPAPNTYGQASLYVNNTLSWLIQYLQFDEVTGIKMNRETGAIVQATINAKWSSHWNGNAGSVVGPGGVTLWPITA